MKNAGGATTKLKNDISGSFTTMTATSPISVRKSRPTEVIKRLITCVQAAAPVDSRAMNSVECRFGEKADAFAEQLGEDAPLVVGDDAVADLRQQYAVAVGREALGGEQGDGDAAEDEDARSDSCRSSLR